jgi:dGTP triphosphohydrolase
VPALPAVEDGGSSNTKARLSNILNSFQDFDQSMKVGVRQRKEKDEHRVAQLTTELTRLEKLLNVEIKRRVELNKSIQTWAESEIDKVTGTFKEMIVERSQAIHSRMEQVVAKIDGLEQRFASEMAKIPIDITQRAEHLTAMLVRYVVYSKGVHTYLQALCYTLIVYKCPAYSAACYLPLSTVMLAQSNISSACRATRY